MTSEETQNPDDKVLVAATDAEVGEAAEEASVAIAEIVQKCEVSGAMGRYKTGKVIWSVLQKRKDKNYLAGGDKLFEEISVRLASKTGGEQPAARTLRSFVSMARLVPEKEFKRLVNLPKFAFSKLKAVLDLHKLGSQLRLDGDVEESRDEALKFFEENVGLTTHQIRMKYDDIHTDPKKLASESGHSAQGSGGSGGGSGGESFNAPKSAHASVKGVAGTVDGFLSACSGLVLLLEENGGPQFNTEKKRDNFCEELSGARSAIVGVADTCEAAIAVIEKWEAASFQTCVNSTKAKKAKPEEKKEETKSKTKINGNKKAPLPTSKEVQPSITEAMNAARGAKKGAEKRHNRRSGKTGK